MRVPRRRFKECVVDLAGWQDVFEVLDDLSQVEREEQARLGLTSASIYQEQVNGRVFALRFVDDDLIGATPLALLGASELGAIWFLPTETMATKYRRILMDKEIIAWVKQWQMSLDPEREVYFNGVTPEGTSIRNWLERYVGAKFMDYTVASLNGHPVYPFIMHREPAHVRT